VGRDRAGNETPREIQVVLQEQASRKRLVALAGDAQAGVVGTNLPEALLVELVDSDGVVQTNQPVTFSVTRGDGLLLAPPDSGRSLTMQTDDKGRASVIFKLGTRAGSGNNQVTITSPGVQAPLTFNAHGVGAAPARVLALIPETQVGEVGKPLAQPWTALVTDGEGNPVEGAPLTFLLMQGGGSFGGQTMITTNTDSDGRASVVLTLGMEAGLNNHVVLALAAGVTNSSVTFVASAQTPQAVPNTRVVGLVLDNANRPMSNVLCIIYRTFLAAVTDENGRFVISNAPVGAIRLLVDARERGYPGEWHALEFDLVTVAGRDNSVDRPIYMLPLDSDHGTMAGGPQDVQLRLKGIPGATMTVFANSVRDNNGNRITNRVTWTEVNQERVPMAPPKGAQFSLAWTVQPPGMRFDPPARICIPNAGLGPGQVLEMFGFDHDLGAFVSLGTGTVTPDGSQVCSDAGFGVTKSGWGGFIPPRFPCTAVCSGPRPSPCFDYITHPGRGLCDCPRFEERPKSLVRNVVAQVNGKKQASGGTNTIFNFTVASEHPDCANVTYQWEFDDGETSALQNPTHTFGGYRTFHPKVTVACQSCPQSKVVEQLTVAVAAVNLVLHRPKGIDPAEPEIPHDLKLTVGAQTFVNLDNDDGDSLFDFEEDTIVGGDDELVKVRIQIPADADPGGTVRLEVTDGAEETTRLWQFATKSTELARTNELRVADFTDVDGGKEFTLYVEGFEAHTVQRDTRLKARFLDFQSRVVGEDHAAITVLGLAGLAWEGKFNSVSNQGPFDINHPLDLDPNWPAAEMAGLPPAVRVFPDARIEQGGGIGAPRDKVRLKARLSVAPVEPVRFYFRAFDVDDPSDNRTPIDNDLNAGNGNDNRGSPATGTIAGADPNTGMLALTFDAEEIEKTFEFQTTMHPGDNWRIAGSGDPDFLLTLVNDDTATYANNLPSNLDKQLIVDPRILPQVAFVMEMPQAIHYVSPTLTVWRFIHVETDSMRAPTEDELAATAAFTRFEPSESGLSFLLQGMTLPPDGSKNLDNEPAGWGRFENGKAVIGTVPPTAAVSMRGNGHHHVVIPATNSLVPLAFRAQEDKLFFPTTIEGIVTNISLSDDLFVHRLHVTSQSSSLSNWNALLNGWLSVGGGGLVRIVDADQTASSLASIALNIPIKLWDDDSPTNLPAPADLTHLATVLGEVYVKVLPDGGSSLGNNEQTNAFVLNVPSGFGLEDSFRRQSGGTDAFWVGYVLQSYQYDDLKDLDPDNEDAVLGVALALTSNTVVQKGGDGTQVFTEPNRDPGAFQFPAMVPRVTAHEICHQMGLHHWDTDEAGVPPGPVPSNLMLRAVFSGPDSDAKLIPMHKHLLRSRVKSPGK
jgi:PKD repeat protein